MIRKEHQRFSLRKYKVGVASVFLGFGLSFALAGSGEAQAAETNAETATPKTETTAKAETPKAETTAKAEVSETATANVVVPKAEEIAKKDESTATSTKEATAKKEETSSKVEANKDSEGDKPRVRSRRATGTDRSATAPIEVSNTEGAAEATPAMTELNGASLKNRDLKVPTPKDPAVDKVTTGVDFKLNPNQSQYTFIVTDLHNFNKKYNTKYYYRMSKPYDDSTNVTIELVDGNTNSVVETKSINGAGTVNLGQSVLAPLTGNSQAYIQFRYEDIQDADKSSRPALRATWKYTGLATDFDGPRSALQIYDVVNAANEGTSITDPQYYIPRKTQKTTYYKVVDRESKTFDANRTDVNPQTYTETGREESLGTFTITGMEGQDFHASGLRQFAGYKLYQTADGKSLEDVLKKPYTVGQRWFDVANAEGGVKRIKEVVKEDGTVRIEMWAIKSDSLGKISKDLNTDGYVKVYETIIRPGSNNKIDHPEDLGINPEINDTGWNADNNKPSRDNLIPELRDKLVVGKPFAIFSDKQNTNYKGDLEFEKNGSFIYKRPNGTFYKLVWASAGQPNDVHYEEIEVSASDAASYKARYSSAGEFYVNRGSRDQPYAINGVPVGSGNIFRLENKLTRAYETVYYYVKQEPAKVTPEVEKALEGRVLADGEFSFKLKKENVDVSVGEKPYEEVVTNKADGKATFSELTFNKAGTYTYKITEIKGADENVDYDAMEVTMTVTVAEKNAVGDLEATVKYSAEGGFKSSETDKIFNNYVVAPVETQFDFSKALAGRTLKADEFSFVLKDSEGTVIQTKKNDANGKVSFDKLIFKNTQVGEHKYTVEEVIPTEKEAGMTYDTMKAEVTVKVTKAGHVLTATKILPGDTEFNNTFTPPATKAQFTFTKKLEGKNLEADAFTFELLENGNVIQTKKNAANGTITFDEISYNQVGKHTYTVREVAGTDTNIDYDKMNAEVTVDVTKNAGTGLLSAAVTMPEDTEFNNYVVAPVKAKFDFTKKLAGRTLKEDEFSFVLKNAQGEEVETVKNKADGTVTFTELSFDNSKVGTHTYTVEEVIPAAKEAGMVYDTMKATITVEVAKNGHTLTTVTNVVSAGGVDANGKATDGTADKEFNNKITPPETPVFQPEKYVVNKEKFDLTGESLLDDDKELTDKYTETNANPYADLTKNNEAENINTKTVERGDKLVYQVWLDTKNFTDKNNIQSVGISDTYEADKLTVNAADIKAYDSTTGVDVTSKFDIKVENGVITATSKASMNKSLGDADNTQVIDTTKFAFGRYYKFDIPATVKADVAGGVDIENKANQIVHVYNPVSKSVETPEKPTQKRVNSVPISVEFNFTKKLEGRVLKDKEFSFVLKDSTGKVVETVKNDAAGNVKFSALKFKKGEEGAHKYTVEEVVGTDTDINYDSMKANVTITVSHDGTAKALVATLGAIEDKEFNNSVKPPEEPKFQPEKYVLNKEKVDLTGDKLLDDDKELENKVADTNANPYADDASNNEAENINTKTVNRGDKLVYQVWLDTTKFSANNKENVQSVGISDDYDETKLELDATKIKAYDSVTGDDVTNKFDITVNNGVITATLKAGFTKSLGDADNTQVIDTTKFAFGRYYKFDIPATVKADVAGGVDIENTAAQVVNYYNPVSKTVEKPNKPTEKRVNSVPVQVEFNFTKKLEGRVLKDKEFSFVLKDSTGKVVETVKNDAAGNVKFSALKFKKGEEGAHKYTVEEVVGTDTDINYDSMKANVTITVSHDGTAKALVATLGAIEDKEFNNSVKPPEEPKFQPEKYVVSEEKFDITGDKLVDDDGELANKVADTNANPYADDASNNEKQNLNTKTVKRGDKLVYQVWLDTTKFDATNKDNIQSVGISDDYDEAKLNLDETKIKAYDSVTGDDVTSKFDITVNNGVITATLKDGFTKSLGDAENTQIIDTTKFAFGRYYKFDIPTTVKADVAGGVDIENTAAQVVNYYNPTTKKVEKPNKPTEKRVNSVPVQVEFNFTKKLEGRELKANEFSFTLKDAAGKVIETVKNDADGKVKFTAIEFKKGQEGTYNYTVEEVAGTDATVTYDSMVAKVKVVVSHDGTAKALVTNVTDAEDKEFNNVVTPPEEPKFQPEKYVVSEEKFDITGDKLVDDDKELANKVADTNANPYADDASNNEKQNLNTKTVKRGDKLVYQVWLDTTKFDATNKDNIQSVGISDDYDEAKLNLDETKIKAYDSVTGDDVTSKFDITVNNGVITATLKDGFTKSLGDAENTQIIDTTKFAFGRYYKFDIPTTVKADVAGGVDIENTAAQVVNYYNPTTKKVEKPNKPTEKRVNSVPVQVEFNFTKKLEGRELKANEFSFVLKDSTGKVVETVSNDKDGNVKFSAIEFKKEQAGVHNYTVEEVKGSDATVTYDTMKANVTVTVKHDGTAKVLIATVGDIADKEFNNRVTPPETPEFNPEKYVLNEKEFDLTGTKLLDDDKELANKDADTNANPYADKADNNEAQNINTKSVKPGQKLVYQVWLDTTKFDANNKDNVQSVGISDDYDEAKLDLDATKIKAYDSVTGDDVTNKFDITVNNGVITATLKAGFTKSLGDADNTQVIDTTKFEFGRYYKFDIPATIKATAKDGVDIENTASQTVHQYNPTKKSVEKPEKPTETRVVNIPTKVEFNFTKKLEGRQLKEGEFSFVLKDKEGNVIETVKNDASGNIKFSALEFKRGEEGTYKYTVEEVKGTESGVEYDKMVATVTVTVTKEGKVLTASSQLPEDTEFNNKVIPPIPPTPTTPPSTPPTPPTTPPTPPTTPPTPPTTPPTPVKPPKPVLPNTGEESTSGMLAGFGTLLAGIALAVRRRKDEE